MRSVERGIYPIASSTMNELFLNYRIAHARNGHISTSGLKSDVNIVFLDPISYKSRKFRQFAYI